MYLHVNVQDVSVKRNSEINSISKIRFYSVRERLHNVNRKQRLSEEKVSRGKRNQ
jgi:hypothetical protein